MNKTIKYLVMDVDGTLTDGKIYMGANGEMMKAFSIKDGYGIHDILPVIGITPVIITGRKSQIVGNRCKEIGIHFLFQGVTDKGAQIKSFLAEVNGGLSNVAYIGDDLNDMSCMKLVKDAGGIIGSPADAHEKIRKISDFIAKAKGGDGAVREFIDYLSINSLKNV